MENILQTLERISNDTPESRINAKRAELASKAGLDPDTINIRDLARELALDWANNCLIVELRIGRARFERALAPPDLGLDDEELEEYIHTILPGRQLLVTGEYKKLIKKLNALESRARRVLEKYSFRTVFGPAVPCVSRHGGLSPFEKLSAALSEVEREYRETYLDLQNGLQEIWRATSDMLNHAAKIIYQKNSPEGISLWEFQTKFVANALSKFPTQEQVERAFRFQIIPSFVPLQFTPFQGDQNPNNHTTHAAAQLKQEVIESIRQNYQEKAQDFVEDIIAELRLTVYETVSLALDTLRRSGTLPGPTIQSLRQMITQIDDLNFIEDNTIIDQINALRDALGTTKERGPGRLGLVLEQLRDENRQFLLALGREPRAVRSRATKAAENITSTPITPKALKTTTRKQRGGGGSSIQQMDQYAISSSTLPGPYRQHRRFG